MMPELKDRECRERCLSGLLTVLRQGSTYLVVGAATALLELGLFELLLFLGMPLALSNILAVCVATAANFGLNGTVTFKASSNYLRSLGLYLLLFGANMAFSTWAIGALVELGLASYLAKGITMVCIVSWNFILYKKVVFL